MSRRKIVTGKCKLCGVDAELTFEHVPPQSAFNKEKITEIPFEKLEGLESFDEAIGMKGRVSQRGMGGYYLCAPCNNNTGSWYGPSYARWAGFGHSHLEKSAISEVIKIHPLRVIKQIASNFLCIRNNANDEVYKELVEFVLDRDKIGLPDGLRIFISGTYAGIIRKSDFAVLASEKGVFRFSEIVFPPFICMLTFESDCPENRLIDISGFASYSYDQEVEFKIMLSALPVNTPYPADYRQKDEIYGNVENFT